MNAPPIDLVLYSNLKNHLKALAEQRKVTKTQIDQIEEKCIQTLVSIGVRFVDESDGKGMGPYHCLAKSKTEGGWNNERYLDFFRHLLEAIQQGHQLTPVKCVELATSYLKQFEKRKLKLNKVTQRPKPGIEDLQKFLQGLED